MKQTAIAKPKLEYLNNINTSITIIEQPKVENHRNFEINEDATWQYHVKSRMSYSAV